MKQFQISDILSITTGRLVSTRHMEGVYEILNHMTRDNLFTHQLPRAAEECKPHLLRQHPALAHVDTEAFDVMGDEWTREDREKFIAAWLAEKAEQFGETLPVEPIPADDHERKDPYDELVAMRGTDEGVIVIAPTTEAK